VGGLGLAICRRIVEESGGTIEVFNHRKGGACIRVDLPIAS
jgi:K+-sensing histidine kinase KdpD